MTFDESKAEPRQRKPVQIFISVFSVSLMLYSLPAQHGSGEHQIVTVAFTAQSSFHLEEQKHKNCCRCCAVWGGCSILYLADFCSVLQAVVKRVSGETSGYTHHGQNTSEHGTQD